MWLASLFVLTTIVLLLPLLPALMELWWAKDIRPLRIVHDHDGRPCHFADGFRQFVADELENLSTVGLCAELDHGYSRVELKSQTADHRLAGRQRVEQLVVSERTLDLPDGCDFAREIYARGEVHGGNYNHFRAVLAEGRLYLRHKSVVKRWAHADSVYVSAHCQVMGRLTADTEIVIDPDSHFYYLHAPTIRFSRWWGRDMAEVKAVSVALTTYQARSDIVDESGRWLIPQDISVPAYSLLTADMVIHGALDLGMGCVVKGSIKAQGRIRLAQGVRVTGTLISEAGVEVGTDGIIAGPVVSETEILIGAGAIIGSLEQPTSVTAPMVRIHAGAVVHGTVWARGQAQLEGQDDD